MQQFVLEGKVREERGKNAMRRLRAGGQVPGVLYGGKGGPLALVLNARQLSILFRTEAGHNAILNLQVPGRSEEKALLKDWLVDPITGNLLHVDLLRIAMDVRMRVRVPVHHFGEPAGVKQQGGVFEMVTREVVMIGKQIRAGDLPLDPAKMKLVGVPVTVLAHVVTMRKEEEVVPEAAAAATVVAATPAEPEVIKKGKKEVEEGEEAEKEK